MFINNTNTSTESAANALFKKTEFTLYASNSLSDLSGTVRKKIDGTEVFFLLLKVE